MRTLWILTLVAGSFPAVAQTKTETKTPAFDVVSIRENKGDTRLLDYAVKPDGYRGRGIPLALLMVAAFAPADGNAGLFNPDQIDGMPDWMMRDHYDVEAKVADEDIAAWKQPEVQRAMLEQLLVERLKLATHRDHREKQVYDLVLTKKGPKFKPSQTSDIAVIQQTHPGAMALPGGAVMVRGTRPGEITLLNTSMADLGIVLGKGAGRPIEDKTGLSGKYDVTLVIDMSSGPDGARPDPMSVLINALDEQLGLKLQAARESIEVLVVDHVERPSEN